MKFRYHLWLSYLLLLLVSVTLGQSQKRSEQPRGRVGASEREKEVLLKFKESVKDPTGVLEHWKPKTDPCLDYWSGIECSLSYRIQAIHLPGFDLDGPLPELTEFTALTSIRMPDNSLTGSLPNSWRLLSLLETIDLRGNNITGPLPESWSDAPSLQFLFLSDNEIEGELPEYWWLGTFHTIALARNQIRGLLPANWGNMENLEILDLSHNELQGILPPKWRILKRLEVLRLSGNALFGSLPEVWSEMENMIDLRLDGNYFVGELPPRWGFLLKATILQLNDNNLGGFVPEKWSALSKTCRIDLSDNLFICSFLHTGALIAKGDGYGFVLSSSTTNVCPSHSSLDTQALLQFRAEVAFHGDGGVLESWDWKGNSACADDWTGIECENGRVVGLDLSSHGLSGYLSDKLSKLQSLKTLKLDQNKFDGVLPGKWGDIKHLQHLNISGNSLGGVLPADWENLEELEELDVSDNSLLGRLPSEWSRLRNLKVFKGINNALDGQLPFSWSNMRRIKHIELRNNILTGALPVTWKSLSQIEILDLSNNNLLGPVPPEWKNMTELEVFYLQGNERLCGGIPAALPSQPPSVRRVLSQSCPDYVMESILLVNFKSTLEDPSDALSLWNADSPSCLPNFETWPGIECESGRVVEIDLTGLDIYGPIPVVFSSLPHLYRMHLGGNRFMGELPQSWSALTRLESLNVSDNRLSGTLPIEWESLRELVTLDLSGNNFDGPVPEEWSNMAALRQLDVSNVGICGRLPEQLQDVELTHDNSTLLDSCHDRGDSLAAPVVTILLAAFIFFSISIWIICFCCCCYQRNRQRGKLKEMISGQKSREMVGEAPDRQTGTFPIIGDDGPSASDRTSHSGTSRRSPEYRFEASYEVPSYVPHASRALHPYLPSGPIPQPQSSDAQQRASEPNRKPVPGRARSQRVSANTAETSIKPPVAFGSTQSLPVTGVHDEISTRSPRTPARSSKRLMTRSRSEMLRASMTPSATPTESPSHILQARRQTTLPSIPVINPRKKASKIPRRPGPSPSSPLNSSGSSTYRSHRTGSIVSESMTSGRSYREKTDDVSGPSSPSTSSYQIPSAKMPPSRPTSLRDETMIPSTSAEPRGSEQDKDWKYGTIVEIPSPKRRSSSPTTEMFKWLESVYHSGTFDLEEAPTELLHKAVQQHGTQTAVPDLSSLIALEKAKLNAAPLTTEELQSSTRDLLMWVESRIEEVRQCEVQRSKKRDHPVRRAWAQTDGNEPPLFNYKTSSTINDS